MHISDIEVEVEVYITSKKLEEVHVNVIPQKNYIKKIKLWWHHCSRINCAWLVVVVHKRIERKVWLLPCDVFHFTTSCSSCFFGVHVHTCTCKLFINSFIIESNCSGIVGRPWEVTLNFRKCPDYFFFNKYFKIYLQVHLSS